MKLLLIACGGAAGTILRYLLGGIVQNRFAAASLRVFGYALPVGTLAVNMAGCLVAGILAALFARHLTLHEPYRLALTVGVLGGFTTFSAFELDTFALLQRGHVAMALLNMAIQCLGGLAAVAIGYAAAMTLVSS